MIIWMLTLLVGCSPPRPALSEHVAFSGCLEILEGPVCTLRETSVLRLWIDGTDLEVFRDGAPVLVTPIAVGGGWRVELPAEGDQLLEATYRHRGRYRFELELASHVDEPVFARARAAYIPEDPAPARGILEQEVRPLSPAARSLLARVVRGDDDRVIELLEANIPRHLEAGHLRSAARDIDMLRYHLARRPGGFARIEHWLGRLPEVPSSADHAWIRNGLELYAAEVRGDSRSGHDAAREAIVLAERAGHPGMLAESLALYSRLLASSGQHEEAVEVWRRSLASATACSRQPMLLNLAWTVVIAAQHGVDAWRPDLGFEDVHAVFEAAVADPDCSSRALASASAAIGRGWAAHLQRDDETALRLLASLPEDLGTQDVELALRSRWLRADIARQVDVTGPFLEAARAAGFQDLEVRAAWLHADALAAQGNTAEALELLEEAGQTLRRFSLLVPAWQGRDRYLGDRLQLAAGHVAHLAAVGRLDEAGATWRSYRASFLRGLQVAAAREGLDSGTREGLDTALGQYGVLQDSLRDVESHLRDAPGDARASLFKRREELRVAVRALLDGASARVGALPPPRRPAPGELLLAWLPIGGRLHGLAIDDSGTTLSLAEPDPLAPFDEAIARARRVTLLPLGSQLQEGLHLLPWRGTPLISQREVAVGLDLGVQPADVEVRRVLVVADPTVDLPHARREGRAVASRWREAGAEVVLLEGRDATATAVVRALPGTNLLHVAAHARYDGVSHDGRLELADDTSMSISDILGLEEVPDWVVLSGCETARASEARLPGLGLAQAFLTAGAAGVIASDRPTPDAATAEWMIRLHELLPGATLGEVFRQTAAPEGESPNERPLTSFRWMTP